VLQQKSAPDCVNLIFLIAASHVDPEIPDHNIEDTTLEIECCSQEGISITAHYLLQVRCFIYSLSALLQLPLKSSLQDSRRPGRIGAKEDAKQCHGGRDHGDCELSTHTCIS
jgi:hypothetical protein